MKSTAERLGESYCKPQTEGECKSLGIGSDNIGTEVCMGWKGVLVRYIDAGRTKIPAPHFHDQLHDRIAPWRLEEDGIKHVGIAADGGSILYGMNLPDKHSAVMVKFPHNGSTPELKITELSRGGRDYDEVSFKGVKTYTDLLTLLKLKIG